MPKSKSEWGLQYIQLYIDDFNNMGTSFQMLINDLMGMADTQLRIQHENFNVWTWIDSLVQDCIISSALAMEILQFCTKPSISHFELTKDLPCGWTLGCLCDGVFWEKFGLIVTGSHSTQEQATILILWPLIYLIEMLDK